MTKCPFGAYNQGMNTDEIVIGRAAESDIPAIGALLVQVNNVHSALRPDLFRMNGRKYTDEALISLLRDETRPVFAARLRGVLVGYAFCIRQKRAGADGRESATLYIDDLCVDERMRGTGIGRTLFAHVLAYARESGCYNVTLNVWNGNEAALRFYKDMGLHIQKYGMELVL